MKILHFSDRHGRDRDADTIEKMDAFLIETARQEKPDVIINAGDTFDSQDVRMGSRSARQAIEFHAALADIAPVVVIRGTESHDGNAPEILRWAKGKNEVYVASYPRQVYLEDGVFYDRPAGGEDFKAPDAILTLIPQVTKQFFKTGSGIADADREIGQAMTGLFAGFGAQAAEYPGAPHILVYHGGISGARLPSGHVRTGMDIEVSTDQMMMMGPDLVCMGHIHQPQFLGDRCFYSGPIYPVKIDEQECEFYIHEIGLYGDADTPWLADSRYIPTPITKTARIKVDATDEEAGMFNETPPDIFGADVRYEITAWQDEAEKINRAEIEKAFIDAGALSVDVRITRVPRVNVRAESVLKAETLVDKLKQRAELSGETIDPGVLELAGILEGTAAERVLEMVMRGEI